MWILSRLEVVGIIKSSTKKYLKFHHLRISFTIEQMNSNNILLSGLVNLGKSYVYIVDFKILWSLLIEGVQLPQGYRATMKTQFTFYHEVPRNIWYCFVWPQKDERLSRLKNHPVVALLCQKLFSKDLFCCQTF